MNNDIDWPRYAGQIRGVLLSVPGMVLSKEIKGVKKEQKKIISEFLNVQINKEVDRIRKENRLNE